MGRVGQAEGAAALLEDSPNLARVPGVVPELDGDSHPDHLAVGEATLAAVYPDARNPRAYSELLAQGFEPHRVKEVWLPGFDAADVFVDATHYMDRKIQAIMCHASQFAGRPGMEDGGPGNWIRERMKQVGERAGYEYAEGFRKLETA